MGTELAKTTYWLIPALLLGTSALADNEHYDTLIADCESLIAACDTRWSNSVGWRRGTMLSEVESNLWSEAIRDLKPLHVLVTRQSTMIVTATGSLQQTSGYFIERPNYTNETWQLVTEAWTNINAYTQIRRIRHGVLEFKGLAPK